MSTDLICFLTGVGAAALWAAGIKRGVMLGRNSVGGVKPQLLVRRESSPTGFWTAVAIVGCVAAAMVVLPILSWMGLRS